MNSDPKAVAFTTNEIRPLANYLAQSYYLAKEVVNLWNAQNVSVVIPPGGTDVIADDTAHPITDDQAYAIILQAQNFINLMESNSNANLFAVLTAAITANPQ